MPDNDTTTTINLYDTVQWLECPGSLSVAQISWVRGISPCGKYALIWWLRNPVPTKHLKKLDIPKLDIKVIGHPNHWSERGIDLNTRDNLTAWVQEYERLQRIANN